MKIELRNIVMIPSMTKVFDAFTAKVYIDGKHAAYVRNSGKDVVNQIDYVGAGGARLVEAAEIFCSRLPEKASEYNGKAISMKMSLSNYMDDLVTQHLLDKEERTFNRKLQKAMLGGVVIGKPGDAGSFVAFKLKPPIELLLRTKPGCNYLRNVIMEEVLPELKDGTMILNTNIPEHIYQDAGLRQEQYYKVQPMPSQQQEFKNKRRNNDKQQGI